MTLKIYNSLTRKKETFTSLQPGRVGMYVCGPTVYDVCHIGHARSAVVFDVIARYLRAIGYQVTYARNFTDVDDKIINRAKEMEISSEAVAERYIAEYYEDMDRLNIERPTHEPRATEHIADIIQLVETLIEKGNAYDVDGDVYFSVESFEGYGKLSGRKLEDMEAGARVAVDQRKKNPFDFALWKSAKPGEPFWNSPWGKGRPGWHIECSAMGSRYLGQSFDIHGGGMDLIFPHHENEIAQSECAFGSHFVRYWVHNGFVNIDHEKMSKSLGNFLMIRDVLKQYHPEAVRLFLLSKQYRSPIDFTGDAIADASSGLDKIYASLQRADRQTGGAVSFESGGALGKMHSSGIYWNRFIEAMDDDFNSARGIGCLFEAVREINRILDNANDAPGEGERNELAGIVTDIRRMGTVFGILGLAPAAYFEDKKALTLDRTEFSSEMIDDLVQQRSDARRQRDWEAADRVRIQLEEMNVVLEDRPDGTVWKFGNRT